MQGMELTGGWDRGKRKRVEAAGEPVAALRGRTEKLAEVAHDARNMVTALGLYCDLLEEPGVLATPFLHYGNELRLVAAASHRLVDQLVDLSEHAAAEGIAFQTGLLPFHPKATESQATGRLETDRLAQDRPAQEGIGQDRIAQDRIAQDLIARDWPLRNPHDQNQPGRNRRWSPLPAEPIANLAEELLAARNLLAALAGPTIALTVNAEGGDKPVRMTGEDLTRVLVNLVKNAAEAMPAGGLIQLALRERPAQSGVDSVLILTIEDDGPGIPLIPLNSQVSIDSLEQILHAGVTTRANDGAAGDGWQAARRGLGLRISRSIVEAAGGRIHAANRPQGGARFEIELPSEAAESPVLPSPEPEVPADLFQQN